MDYQGIRTFIFQKILDHILTAIILAILILMAFTCYRPLLDMARSIQITGSPFQEARLDILRFYALHGTWPKDNQEALAFGWHNGYGEDNPDTGIMDVQISDGAIDFYLKGEKENNIITLRPAFPAGDPSGPVIWVCGDDRAATGWQIQGRDRTNFDKNAIHPRLR